MAEDIGVDAVKIGMLGDAQTIAAVGQALDLLPASAPVVVDPVMVAESGARLLDESAVQALRQRHPPARDGGHAQPRRGRRARRRSGEQQTPRPSPAPSTPSAPTRWS